MSTESLHTWSQVAIIVGLAIGLLGTIGTYYFGKKLRTEESGEIQTSLDDLEQKLRKITAKDVSENPEEAAKDATGVQEDSAASSIGRAIAVAVLLQQQGNIEEAIEKWHFVANIAGEVDHRIQARAWFSIGYLHYERDEWEAAMDAYTKAIELNPAFAEAYVNRGSTKNSLGRHEAAIADYDRAIELTPADAYAHYNLGNAKNSLGRHEAAIADYDRAIELNPANADAYNNLGNAKSSLGRHEAAIADYDRAIELNQNMAEAYNNRGNRKKNLGRLNEAREDYQQALALAQASGDEHLVAAVKRNLSRLDNDEAPRSQRQ